MQKKRLYIITVVFGLFLLSTQTAYAQPPNNNCSGAFPVTPDGTCYGPGLPQTTTVGAGNSWIGTVGCQANSSNNEVWFTFVATASQLDVTLIGVTLGGNMEFVLVESLSPPCAGLTLSGSLCGASPLTGSINGLQVGSTYYYTINGTGSAGTFTTCVNNVVPSPVSGQDCSASALLCDGSGFSQGTSSAGFGVQEVSTGNSCWGSGGERQSKWFQFTIGCTGTLELNINPVINGDDYDWAIWDVTGDPTCAAKGNSIACDWSGCKGSTGMSSCPLLEPGVKTGGAGCFGGPADWETPITVTAGNTYALLVDKFSTSNSGFSISFGGACATGTAVIGPNADFTGSLDVTCMVYTSIKTCPTANSTYLWSYGDGGTSTGMNGSHTYSTTGTYTVSYQVTDALGCIATSSQTLNVGCLPLPISLTRFTGEVVDNEVQLAWTTETELNNDYFTIERSKDGKVFEVAGLIDGAGNSTLVNNYNMQDRKPYSGTSYYRLKQTDYDGESTFSKTIAVNIIAAFEDIIVFPNPVQNWSYLSFRATNDKDATVVVHDISGREVLNENYSIVKGDNKFTLNTNELNQGMYFLTLTNGVENITIKFIKN